MSTREPLILAALALALGSGAACAQGPRLGKPISAAELAAWDISIQPDGAGLPPGSGTPAQGARIYAEKCVACHGENGKGGTNAALAGGAPIRNMSSVKTIANFWPYATTIFDFVRRAMPANAPKSLSNQEVYALTAYLLYLNKLIGENDTIDAKTLPAVKMPNVNNFIIRFPERI
jgi:cytochrome c